MKIFKLVASIAAAFWMARFSAIAWAASDSPRSLRLQVLNSYGEQLKYNLVTLNSENGQSALSYCKNLVCTQLRFGIYTYKLRRPSTGDVLEGKVSVTEPEQVLTVDAGPGGGSASRDTDGFTIQGTVKLSPGSKPPEWVRLQSLFSQWSILVSVGPTGHFVLEYVPPGTALLLLFRAGAVVHTELISTKAARSNRINLEVTLGPPPTATQVQ